MHWTEAVNVSKVRIALRQDNLGLGFGRLMYRNVDGTGEIELMSSARKQQTVPEFRPAMPWELEGFLDWSPATSYAIDRKEATR